MGELNSDIQYLSGVGPKRAEMLRKELGVATIGDLLRIYPFRYIDRSSVQKIASLDASEASVQIQGRIISETLYGKGGTTLMQRVLLEDGNVQVRSSAQSEKQEAILLKSASRLSVIVDDSSGTLEMVFFKGIRYNWTRLIPGAVFLFFGKPQEFNGRLNIVHPEVDPPQKDPSVPGTLTGVYPSTENLKNAGITGKVMCRMMNAALALCLGEITETLTDKVMKDNSLCSLKFAIKNIHFPSDSYALQKAVARLKFEELFFLQLSLLRGKFRRSRFEKGIPMPKVGPAFKACYDALPYELTGAQKRVIKEIRSDMMGGGQMNRLLQGDVGSGKTLVAVLSCLIAEGNGYQSCIMAPTEVLARQHFINISRYLAPTGLRCALLTGSTPAKERREIHSGLEDGSISVIVGTHALIEDNVVFNSLGLAVIDEQHRFGVDQRARLWSKGKVAPPHVLVMTATPIPRTLAMTVYGDLDVSVIDELPPGRKPVQTICINQSRKPAMFKFIEEEIASGRQVFIVYPMIFVNEKMDISNVEQGYEEIVTRFPLNKGYKVALVHGQQNAETKQFNMDAFVAGRAQILVSTTVIEVGVDVPNASVMVIESAQRFGLSQLHQLRGRVGRGAEKSYCILVKDYKTSKESQERLDIMCSTENGFEIAEADMKMRGPGDLEGTQQSGLPVSLNIASIAKDSLLLSQARAYAEQLLEDDPALEKASNALLLKELRKDKYNIKDYSKIS
ncbi:MAG: ATP-dependent DNA helicase RecG [Bacteroidales bacterium]|nr:ATP-dependent DNA helicase RecG [Bacteroidales bacterium]